MPEIVGEPKRPQAFFIGFEADDADYRAMATLVARAERLDSTDELMLRYRLAEWDIVVSRGAGGKEYRGSLQDFPAWMHVLALDAHETGWLEVSGNAPVAFDFAGRQPSQQVHIHDVGVPDALRRMVKTELVPSLAELNSRPYLRPRSFRGTQTERLTGGRTPVGTPLVTDADGNAIAGHYARRDNGQAGGYCMVLPFLPSAPERWLLAAMKWWRDLTPHRFTDLPSWQEEERWQTTEELDARAIIASLSAERVRMEADLRRREEEAQGALVSASAAADAGRRRLLTEQGDPLVAAVAEAFVQLGFEVVDADAETAPGAPRMEDLRLHDPTDPGWTNITEVKGYSGGGKTSDLQAMARFAMVFLQRTGRLPSSRWYVVNQFRTQDPNGRAALLSGADEDLLVFAGDGGLAIDTRDLFELVRRVDSGVLEREAARVLLRGASGRFALPG